MPGRFELTKFSDINIDDRFFDSLKEDYPADEHNIGFENWFRRKAAAGATALVFTDDDGLGAFVCLKDENEAIALAGVDRLPAASRIKISTLRIAERYRGQRLGEGALGLALWKWQHSGASEIYVTVFDKHVTLIGLLEKFGFTLAGYKTNGEGVYVKSRTAIDYSDPYKAFPFINPAFRKAGYIIVNDVYHDTLFPYSELKNTLQERVALSVANGICKIYVGAQSTPPHYQPGEPVLIYRRHTQEWGQPRYKSCITSYAIVTDVITVKTNGCVHMTFEQLMSRIGNKSVFNETEMRAKYRDDRNLIVIEMLYYGYFGEGHNVNMDWLDRNGYWPTGVNQYPTAVQLSPADFRAILQEGNVNVQNVIID